MLKYHFWMSLLTFFNPQNEPSFFYSPNLRIPENDWKLENLPSFSPAYYLFKFKLFSDPGLFSFGLFFTSFFMLLSLCFSLQSYLNSPVSFVFEFTLELVLLSISVAFTLDLLKEVKLVYAFVLETLDFFKSEKLFGLYCTLFFLLLDDFYRYLLLINFYFMILRY